MTMTDSRERQRRIAQRWALNPDTDVDKIAAAVDDELAAEREARAEEDAHMTGIIDSMNRMWKCSACGVNQGPYAQDGLCDECRSVAAQVAAERNGSQVVRDGITRRDYVLAYLDRTAAICRQIPTD